MALFTLLTGLKPRSGKIIRAVDLKYLFAAKILIKLSSPYFKGQKHLNIVQDAIIKTRMVPNSESQGRPSVIRKNAYQRLHKFF